MPRHTYKKDTSDRFIRSAVCAGYGIVLVEGTLVIRGFCPG